MAKAYTPGLKVTGRTVHRCRRILPIRGEVLVAQGDRVEADTPVARTFLPGDVMPVNMANLLGVPPADVHGCMLRKEGERVRRDDAIAQTRGIFGMMRRTVKSPHGGTIETISDVTGQLILRGEPIPVEVRAYLSGTVAQVLPGEGVVVEAEITLIQGIFGVGGERSGRVVLAVKDPSQELVADMITPDMKGCVVVGGGRVWHEAVAKAMKVGAAAVVAGGIDDQDLREILGYDLGVAITGSESIPTTVIVTEGFGDIAMADRTWQLLRARAGSLASVNGATQIRAGVMRPEILIPVTPDAVLPEFDRRWPEGQLEPGRPVRIIRDPHFGLIGAVSALPPEPRILDSESKARVLEVTFDSGEKVIIPRANVELIEA
ncbi:MAG: hypothetical protein KF817_06350 [Phycisphaeraceae bacterium]|nr:hypothetical protein [Phycisphaeraceae bacterium]